MNTESFSICEWLQIKPVQGSDYFVTRVGNDIFLEADKSLEVSNRL